MDADITQELSVIKSQPGGGAVKNAIRSALSKLAETRGGTVVQEFEVGQGYDMPVGLIDACVDGVESVLYVQNNDDESYVSRTFEIELNKSSLLIAFAMHRAYPLSISGDGWTRLVECGPSNSSNQYVTVFYKVVSPGTQTITLSQPSSLRLSAKIVILDPDATVSVVSSETKNNVHDFTYPAPTGNSRLYISASALANTSISRYASIINIVPNVSMEETRISAWYADETQTESVTVTFHASDTSYFNAIALDIT